MANEKSDIAETAIKKQVIKRPDMKFYLYRRKDGKLQMKETKIYSPFNVKTQGFETDKFDFFEPKYVTFEKGVYKLSVEEVGSTTLYDQTKEFLSFYNNVGGILTKGIEKDVSSKRNGMSYNAKGKPYYVDVVNKTEEVKDKTKEVIKEVKIQTIPRAIAQKMDFTQLRDLAVAWDIEIPNDIESSGKPQEIGEKYLEILSEHLV